MTSATLENTGLVTENPAFRCHEALATILREVGRILVPQEGKPGHFKVEGSGSPMGLEVVQLFDHRHEHPTGIAHAGVKITRPGKANLFGWLRFGDDLVEFDLQE